MDYLEQIKTGEASTIIKLFESNKPTFAVEQQTALNQYEIKGHAIYDKTLRPDRITEVSIGKNEEAGEDITVKKTVDVNRLGMPYQKKITKNRSAIMLTNSVRIEPILFGSKTGPDEKVMMLKAYIDAILHDEKAQYNDMDIAEMLMSEMQVAELWYPAENTKPLVGDKIPKLTMKLKVLSPSLGDSLYPLFDNTGDMIAFGRGYKTKVEGKDVDRFDVYTAEMSYYYINAEGGWKLDAEIEGGGKVANKIGKISVIYYSQQYPEWNDVQPLIERFETISSNHGEINDYFGSPILAIYGELSGALMKGNNSKILQLEQDAKASFLALNSEPQSIKMELENLEKWIYVLSDTLNLSPEALKGIGAEISGVVLELMFMASHIAVRNKEKIFGMGYQRRINLLKSAIGKLIDTSFSQTAEQVRFKPIITPYMPRNRKELIEMLSTGKSTGIISKDTCVDLNDMITDKEAEKQRLKDESDTEAQSDFTMQTQLLNRREQTQNSNK